MLSSVRCRARTDRSIRAFRSSRAAEKPPTAPAEMQMATYSPDQTQQNRTLMLMQMKMEGQDEQQMEEMEQQLKMQSGQQDMNQGFIIESSETRTFVIDGQDREFVFAVGTNSAGETVHQVTGVFPGRNGTATLMMMDDDANWDEAAIEQMIESISTQ